MVTFKEIFKSLTDFYTALKNYPQFEKNYFELERLIKNADSPLTIMVMGEFSTGKSTFINALLGAEIADTGATETTAIITKFSYGKTDKITAHMKDGTKKNFSAAEFIKLTSKKEHDKFKFREKVSFVERQFPASILKNFTLIDSPGLGALEKDREIVTQNFLLNANAVLWLVNSEQAGGKNDELKYIKNLPQRLKPILIANKLDTLDEEEGDTPEGIINSYKTNFKGKIRAVVGLSAQQALEGKLNNNPALLKESNLQAVIDTIDKIILPEVDDYKIKSLLTKYGLYLHQLEDSVKEIENRIAPLKSIKDLQNMFNKHSAAISEVRQLAAQSAKGLYEYCQKPTTCAEIDFFIGIMYQYGILLNESLQSARRRFNAAAEEKIFEAQIMLGIFKEAADAGNAEAKFKYGTLNFLEEAATQGYADAQYKLANYGNNRRFWLEVAAKNGHALAQFELAKLIEVNDDYQAFYWYSKAYEQGVLESFYQLGQFYLHGRGTAKDVNTAFKYHFWAAELGNIGAMYEIAKAYYEGNGVKKNRVKAFIWLNSAKSKGSNNAKKFLEDFYFKDSAENAETQFQIGYAYQFGKELEKNETEALQWYEKADRQDYLEATYNLSKYYFEHNYLGNFYRYIKKASDGNHPAAKKELKEIFNDEKRALLQYDIANVIRDERTSFKWYLQAAQHGLPAAQNEVGICYIDGRGVEKSTFKAFWWMRKAKAAGESLTYETWYETWYNETRNKYIRTFLGILFFIVGISLYIAFPNEVNDFFKSTSDVAGKSFNEGSNLIDDLSRTISKWGIKNIVYATISGLILLIMFSAVIPESKSESKFVSILIGTTVLIFLVLLVILVGYILYDYTSEFFIVLAGLVFLVLIGKNRYGCVCLIIMLVMWFMFSMFSAIKY